VDGDQNGSRPDRRKKRVIQIQLAAKALIWIVTDDEKTWGKRMGWGKTTSVKQPINKINEELS